MAATSWIPTHQEVFSDLERVREAGVGKLRNLDVPTLTQVARLAEYSTSQEEDAAGIRVLLKEAVDQLGGGSLQESAEYSLGLYRGTALWPAVERRREAADLYGVRPDTFRKTHEKNLLAEIAEQVLIVHSEAKLRQSRLEIQQRKHPADSRLAVQWVERFEAYYRLWTPIYALGADLEAAINTWREEPSEHPPWAPDSHIPYDRDDQALGYGRSALFRISTYWLELKRFMSKHGGLWLLSDSDLEHEVSDTVYRIGWHNELTHSDESFLRRHLADSRHEEAETFWNLISAFSQGQRIMEKWQRMISEGVACETEEEKSASQVWLTIKACEDYCRLIDEDWRRIADWYRPEASPRPKFGGAELYNSLLQSRGLER